MPCGFDDASVPSDDRLAAALKNYERLLRQTLAAGSNLVTAAAEAQVDRRLDPTAGHQIYHAFNAANLDVATALSHTARGHRQLDAMAHTLGIDITGYGKNHPAPDATFLPGFVGADASGHVLDS